MGAAPDQFRPSRHATLKALATMRCKQAGYRDTHIPYPSVEHAAKGCLCKLKCYAYMIVMGCEFDMVRGSMV